MLRKLLFFLLLVALVQTGCHNNVPFHYNYQKTAYSTEGMVVSAHPLATHAGVEILRNGGNAVDAMVAVYLALAVVYPGAGNIGGGGFMVYRNADGEHAALDFREKAPLAATRDMYLDSAGNVIPGSSTDGILASGVPGSIAGLVAAHEKYGSLPWNVLCQEAIRLAREGHPITDFEASRLNATRDLFLKYNETHIPFISDSTWHEGDILLQPELAGTLERISRNGRDEFYSGQTALFLVDEMHRNSGLVTLQDLENYQAVWRQPVQSEYRGYEIIGMPPPSSGGIALAQLLNIATHYPLRKWGQRDIRTIHLITEAERRVYADRATHLGDADFYPVPVEFLLDTSYMISRMEDFNPQRATKSTEITAGAVGQGNESMETTHITVVDGMGNAVAVTTTLNGAYGSKIYVIGAGFLLNNEMDDFSVKPGVPNIYGLVGGEANAIASGKRMLSSMTPTIVERDGNFIMTLGTPGGSTIITSVFQVLLNIVDFDMSASEAVASRRYHHQWLPDQISYESGCFSDSLREALEQMGHNLKEIKGIGLVEVIQALPDGRYVGAADPRGSDAAEGL